MEQISGRQSLVQASTIAQGDSLAQAATIAQGDSLTQSAHNLRIGIGYDVHAFAPATSNRALILGGVKLDYERGLLGHSDADVLAHAISDALLGATRLGDIGEHFPDNDPSFAGVDSLLLLAKVAKMVREHGYAIIDVDSVIIAQDPKIAPYRQDMRINLAKAMQLDLDRVGVKATTTERLGFAGRGEGIACEAVTLLVKEQTQIMDIRR